MLRFMTNTCGEHVTLTLQAANHKLVLGHTNVQDGAQVASLWFGTSTSQTT